MEIIISNAIAFSGHRNLRMDGQELKDELTRVIREEYHNGFRYFITGMAQGFDMIAGEVVAELKQTHSDVFLICAIPFRGQENRYSVQDKQRYLNLLEAADKTGYLSQSYYDGCFLHRNDYMLENAAKLIAHFDGSVKCGTGYTLRRAQRAGKPVINII